MTDLETVEFTCKKFGTVTALVDAHMNVHKWWMQDANVCGTDRGEDVHQARAIQKELDSHFERMIDRA